MEVIWNRGFSESQRELVCLPIQSGGVGLPWAFVLAWPIYVASRKQSQYLQSSMATAMPFDFDSLLPILAPYPLLRHVHNVCKQRLLLLNHNMHFLILFMLGFAANFVLKARRRYMVWFLVARPSSPVCWSYYDCFGVSCSFLVIML
jgi:hypothetical protein